MIEFNFAIDDQGIFHYETRQGFVNPKKHQTIQGIIETIEHEDLHQIFSENFGTTEAQDHFIIEKIGLIDEWID